MKYPISLKTLKAQYPTFKWRYDTHKVPGWWFGRTVLIAEKSGIGKAVVLPDSASKIKKGFNWKKELPKAMAEAINKKIKERDQPK